MYNQHCKANSDSVRFRENTAFTRLNFQFYNYISNTLIGGWKLLDLLKLFLKTLIDKKKCPNILMFCVNGVSSASKHHGVSDLAIIGVTAIRTVHIRHYDSFVVRPLCESLYSSPSQKTTIKQQMIKES